MAAMLTILKFARTSVKQARTFGQSGKGCLRQAFRLFD